VPPQSIFGHAFRDRLHLVRSEALELRRVRYRLFLPAAATPPRLLRWLQIFRAVTGVSTMRLMAQRELTSSAASPCCSRGRRSRRPEVTEAATAASCRIVRTPSRYAVTRAPVPRGPSRRDHRRLFIPASCLPVRVLFQLASSRRASPPKPTRCRPAGRGCTRLSTTGS
jgi:hypothetical protein